MPTKQDKFDLDELLNSREYQNCFISMNVRLKAVEWKCLSM